MLKKIIVLNFAYIFTMLIGFCFSEEELEQLEYSKYGQIYNEESISERLNRLENDFFGMSQNGDIDSRIEKLSKIAENSKRAAIIDPLESYYPGKKKSSSRNFWDNITSSFSDDGIITGYTPSYYNQGYSNNVYRNELFNSLNSSNRYCPYNSSYNNRFFNRFFHNSNNTLNKKAYNKHLPPNGYRNYNPYSNRLQRNYYQIPPSITARSSVHILED